VLLGAIVVPLLKTEDETEPEEVLASEVGATVEPLDDCVRETEVALVELAKPLEEAELDRIADVVPLEKLLDEATLLVEAADDAVVVELFCAARD